MIKTLLRPAITLFLLLSILVGIIYPMLITGIGQIAFPQQVAGSLIVVKGQIVGSALIGQNFNNPRYFSGRPSVTASYPYNALASGGSNLGPLNLVLIDSVNRRIVAWRASNPTQNTAVPIDLVTASASGLDPNITPAAALYQVDSVARVRGLKIAEVRQLVMQHIEGRQLGFLGEPRVNVLELNLALDQIQKISPKI